MACNEDLVTLENWRYAVQFGCGSDTWRLYGQVFNHPNHQPGAFIWPSTPILLDEAQMILHTASGRKYRLGACQSNLEQQLKFIRDDIARGGSEVI